MGIPVMESGSTGVLAGVAASGGGGSPHGEVSTGITIVFGAILVLMILALALEERIHAKKSLITGVFAILSLFLGTWLGILPFDSAPGEHQGFAWVSNVFGEGLHLPVYIPAIDWGVIDIILGSSLFVDVVDQNSAPRHWCRLGRWIEGLEQPPQAPQIAAVHLQVEHVACLDAEPTIVRHAVVIDGLGQVSDTR